MRMNMVKAVLAVAHWIELLLAVRLPLGAANGLRTR